MTMALIEQWIIDGLFWNSFECAVVCGFANWRHNCALVSRCLLRNGAFKMGVACTLNAAHLLMDKYVNGSKSIHQSQYFYS